MLERNFISWKLKKMKEEKVLMLNKKRKKENLQETNLKTKNEMKKANAEVLKLNWWKENFVVEVRKSKIFYTKKKSK